MKLGKQSFVCFSGSLRTFYNACALSFGSNRLWLWQQRGPLRQWYPFVGDRIFTLLFGVWPFLLTPLRSLLWPPSHGRMQLFLCFTLAHKAAGPCAQAPSYLKLFIKSCGKSSAQTEAAGQKPQPARRYWSPVKLSEQRSWMYLPSVPFSNPATVHMLEFIWTVSGSSALVP